MTIDTTAAEILGKLDGFPTIPGARDYAALSDLMEFDHPITVHADGRITDGPAGVYAPDLLDVIDAADFQSDTWELMSGYSGQDRYAGPIMHDSEFIGGGLARDILTTPGTYVAVASYYSPTCTICGQDVIETADALHHASDTAPDYIDREADADHTPDADEDTSEGWAVARLLTDEERAARRIRAGVQAGTLSWGDVAEQSARGWCPASPDGTDPHIVTDGATCDECGATA